MYYLNEKIYEINGMWKLKEIMYNVSVKWISLLSKEIK